MKNHTIKAGALVLFGAIVMCACDGETPSDTGSSGSTSASSSSGDGGAGGSGGGANCVSDPKTHVEIINACTDAEKVKKAVNLPLLNADGTLPPLP